MTVPESFGFRIGTNQQLAGDGQPTNSLSISLDERRYTSESGFGMQAEDFGEFWVVAGLGKRMGSGAWNHSLARTKSMRLSNRSGSSLWVSMALASSAEVMMFLSMTEVFNISTASASFVTE